MDFFEFEKKPKSYELQDGSYVNTNLDNDPHKNVPKLAPLKLPSENTDSMLESVPPIRTLKPRKTPDILFKPREPGTLNPTVLFLDYSSSMLSLGNEPPDSCKFYIQTLYDTAMKESNNEIREKLLNVNVRLIVFNDMYYEIINDSVRNLNNPTFNYSPAGMTDLYSPVYDVMLADSTPKDVIIISDGQNNSGPHRASYMSRQFERAMAAGWSIKFVGCTLDAISESNKLNLRQQTYNCSDSDNYIPIGQVMHNISHEVSQSNRQRSLTDPFDPLNL